MNHTRYESQLHLQLEILRQTDLRPYKDVGVVATILSRGDFIKFVHKFIKESKDRKVNWDKTIIIGDYKGVRYNYIKLIKFTDDIPNII